MRCWVALMFFCGVLPAYCQSLAPKPDFDRALGPAAVAPEYVPMTFSERSRHYLAAAFGPGAVLRAVGGAGFGQVTEEPKEWREGSAAYGDRVGSNFAQQVIREALEFGGSAALHEDNRYFRSTQTGFFRRTKHVLVSALLTRSEGGETHLGYSRLGATLASSFISRAWQPRSQDGPGDAAVNFGFNIAADIGWNFIQEFSPRSIAKHLHGK